MDPCGFRTCPGRRDPGVDLRCWTDPWAPGIPAASARGWGRGVRIGDFLQSGIPYADSVLSRLIHRFFRGGYGLRRGALAGASWWCYVVSSWAWSSFPFSGARCGTKLEVAWSVVCRSQGLAGVCGRSARFLLRLRHQVTPFFLWVGELLQGDLAHCGHPVGRFPEALRTWVPCISRCTSHKSDVTITSSSLPWSMWSSPDDAGRC